jgi:hypothetical protein
VILLDIDFRRCPPILKHVSRTVDWPLLIQMKIERNMGTSYDNKEFSEWLM